MSNQEAIALLRNLEDSLDSYCELSEEGKTAFRMAIEALSSSEIPNSLDTISRKAAIEVVQNRPMMLSKEKVLLINDLEKLPPAQPEQQHGRIFREIVVKYPSYCTYPEYKGKPYFSIKYTENGQEFIGYGTYKPEVLSKYLKEYFMPPAPPERIRGHWVNGHCDKCNAHAPFWAMASTYHDSNFCPNCGAEMEVDDGPNRQTGGD